MRNKKGFLAGALVDVYAFIFFFLIVLLFFIIFKISFSSETNEVMRGSEDIFKSTFYSSTYLKMPVKVGNNELAMSELIALADANPDVYEDIFEDKTEWFIDTFFDGETCFYMSVIGRNINYDYAQSSCTWSNIDAGMGDWVKKSGIPRERFFAMVSPVEGSEPIEVAFFWDIDSLVSAYGGGYSNYDLYNPYYLEEGIVG